MQQQQKRFQRARRAEHDFLCGHSDSQRRHGSAGGQPIRHSRCNGSIGSISPLNINFSDDHHSREWVVARAGSTSLMSQLHQSNFKPNCTWRAVVAVLVMIPAVGETPEGVKTTSFGWLKFARLRMLKISARN